MTAFSFHLQRSHATVLVFQCMYQHTWSGQAGKNNTCQLNKSKGSVSQLMDDLDLIIEQVEVMVNSIRKGVENVLRK